MKKGGLGGPGNSSRHINQQKKFGHGSENQWYKNLITQWGCNLSSEKGKGKFSSEEVYGEHIIKD